MADNDSAVNDFESLWQQAINHQGDQPNVKVEEADTDFSLLSQLQQLSRLADSLHNSDVIDDSQHDQMQAAIVSLTEIIGAVDPAVLAEALESLN